MRLVDDNIVEADEKYNLTINPGSLHNRVKVGKTGTTTIIIKNDDGT